ncbi:TetR/AcrR family transcriptional regulator [Streptomyces sp. NPDC052109]|uniref:TetR/AcrR family transcriptional regulator n=1 Tax=Streptomyces sp. NPDC052109 TaxID=3155527 RepID=UPI003433BEF6
MATQDRARRTYEVILDAAAEEFVSLGYTRATLNGVIAHTGLTKGALYGHFSSKEDLARTLIRYGGTVWTRLLAETRASRLAPLAALRSVTVALTCAIWADVRVRAAFRLASEIPEVQDGMLLADTWAFLVHHAERARVAGQIRAAHTPESVAQLLLSMVFGFQHLPTAQREQPVRERVESLWRIVSPALRPAGDRAEPSAAHHR